MVNCKRFSLVSFQGAESILAALTLARAGPARGVRGLGLGGLYWNTSVHTIRLSEQRF